MVMKSSIRRAVAVALATSLAVAACDSTRSRTPDEPPGGDARTPIEASVDATDDDGEAGATTVTRDDDAGTGAPSCDGIALPKSVARLGCPDRTADTSEMASRPTGFSRDGTLIGGCVSSCDPCPLSCVFRAKDRTVRAFSDYYAPVNARARVIETSALPEAEKERRLEALSKSESDAFSKKVAALGLDRGPPGRPLSGPFPYDDLALVAKGEVDPKLGQATLHFGAAVDGEEPVYPIHIVLPPHPMWNGALSLDQKALAKLAPKARAKAVADARAQLRAEFTLREPEVAYADMTKDGAELGVVALVTGPMWYENAESARMPTRAFVAKIYEETAARRAGRGDTEGGAKLRAKAIAATSAR